MSLPGRVLARILPYVPKSVAGLAARRYIAGETLEDGIDTAATLSQQGFRTTLDLLGEDTTNREHARRALDGYQRTLEAIEARGIDGNVSVKPTQFGLRVDPKLCLELFQTLADEARRLGHFVRVEMEDSSVTDRTLALFRQLRRDFENVGLVLQSCLRRTASDLEGLLDLSPNVRVVKGVYVEPSALAWQDRQTIRDRFVALSETLIGHGSFVAFATHDDYLIDHALRLVAEHGVPPSTYEFQMLLGVRPEIGKRVLDSGHPVRIYVPFGSDWHRYSMRRLRENPRIAGYVVRSLLTGR